MYRSSKFFVLKISIISIGIISQITPCLSQTHKELEEAFRNPPVSASPGCYYYWDSDNITLDGITKDMEAMKAVGIDEPFVANIYGKRADVGGVKVFSEEWWKCMVHAANEAKRLGMHIGYFNCPGWSQSGGPWVKPTETMRYLISRERRVRSGETVTLDLNDMDLPENFQLVNIQAFPAAQYDGNKIGYKIDTTAAASNCVYTLTLNKKSKIRSIRILPSDQTIDGNCIIEVAGKDGKWNTLRDVRITRAKLDAAVGPMVEGPVDISVPATETKSIRLSFTTIDPLELRDIIVSEAPIIEASTERQMGKLWPYPEVTADCYDWPSTQAVDNNRLVINPSNVIDLTKSASNGVLNWRAPKGEWVILLTGMVPTGVFNSPCTPEASGWEIDKMNRDIAHRHYDAFMGEILRRIPAESRSAVRHIVADSYEKGSENWTDGFAEKFEQRYGYSPYPWLPTLTGRIVGSANQSERFLWDMRRLVADLIASEYIGGLKEKANKDGLNLWMENYGHWGYPGEFLNYGGASDEVSGEFWITKPQRGPVEIHSASSAAHIYGKQRVSCESFTDSGTSYRALPEDLKARGDWAFCQGVNHNVLHVYVHQPDDRKPGFYPWFGTDFHRNNTWFTRARSYFDYLRRCCALLQQGSPFADIAYYIGENTPRMTGEMYPALPDGYDYDFVNAEVLLKARVNENGRVELPSGTSYAVLVLPSDNVMRPAVAEHIVGLMKQGAHVIGNAPISSPSLEDYPECDDEVKSAAKQMTETGLIDPAQDMEKILHSLGVQADCQMPESMLFTHRVKDNAHIYFVSNQQPSARVANVTFRVSGLLPELWDAVSGEVSDARRYKIHDGMTDVEIPLEAAGSVFVVFRKTATKLSSNDNDPMISKSMQLKNDWTVTFNPSYAEPWQTRMYSLKDWTENEDSRIKYFSGSAVYQNTFEYQGGVVRLDLGALKGLAAVKVNGCTFPVLWTAPYSIDITNSLKEGANSVEIEITNTWWNRLVGDCQPGATPVTFTTNHEENPDSELRPAGLLGPVTLNYYE